MNYEFPRIESGIKGLDCHIEGGFPHPSVQLVTGPAGTGKTTFTQKFLFSGADKGEKGVYFTTLSEPPQWVIRYLSKFDYINKDHMGTRVEFVDLSKVIRDGDPERILDFIDDNIGRTMAKRVVIDPVTVIESFIGDDYRPFLFDLVNHLKNWQAVTMLTGEVKQGEDYPADAAYSADGVILLTYAEDDGARRKYIEILKMRGTCHRTGKLSFSITKEEGIVILSDKF